MFLGAFLFLVFLFFHTLPTWINSDRVRTFTQRTISQKIGGRASFKTMAVHLFPRPHASLLDVSLVLPDEAAVQIYRLDIYPELSALIRGILRPYRLNIIQPDVKTNMNAGIKKSDDDGDGQSENIRKYAEQLGEKLTAINPNLDVFLEKGSLHLFRETSFFFHFHDIEGNIRISSGRITIAGACASNIWHDIDFQSMLNLNTMNGKGDISFKGLDPQKIASRIFHVEDVEVDDTKINLEMAFVVRNLTDINATLKSSLPSVILKKEDESIQLKGGYFDGNLKIDNGNVEMIVNALDLDFPKLSLSGRLSLDPFKSDMAVEIIGTDVDIPSTRKAATTLFADNLISDTIFDIVRGGIVPRIILTSKAKTINALGLLSNLKIRGEMTNGYVYVPKTDLHLTRVNGEVTISDGLLHGRHLEAVLHNSQGCEGTLTIGLAPEDHIPFHLDVMVSADLADLPPVLSGLVPNDILSQELADIDIMEGKACGRLILGDELDHINATVNVSAFSIDKASYGRVPLPIYVGSGQAFYEDGEIRLSHLKGNAGTSSFSDLSFGVTWHDRFMLDIVSGPGHVNAEELYPWLMTFPSIHDVLYRLFYLKGAISLHTLEMTGPVFEPDQWNYLVSGEPEGIEFDADFLEAPLRLSHGLITVDRYTIDYKDVNASSLSSELQVSGRINDYLDGVTCFTTHFSGFLGEKNLLWMEAIAEIPRGFIMKGPFNITRGEMKWCRNQYVSIKSEMTLEKNGLLTIDLVNRGKWLMLNRFHIRDEVSDALIAYHSSDDEWGVSFKGNLVSQTIDHVFTENLFIDGEVTGHFYGDFNHLYPDLSFSQGCLTGNGINLPYQGHMMRTGPFNLSSEEQTVCVNLSETDYLGSTFSMEGQIDFLKDVFDFNGTCHAAYIDLNRISQAYNQETPPLTKDASLYSPWPISATVDLDNDNMLYGERTISPFQGKVAYKNGNLSVTDLNARLCGVSLGGTIDVFQDHTTFNIFPTASKENLNDTLNCLSEKKVTLEGTYTLKGEVEGVENNNGVPEINHGEILFTSKKGRIYNFVILAKTFSVLNIFEMLKGDFPDLLNKGFPYKTIKIKGYFRNNRFIIEEAFIDNTSMGITAKGSISLTDMTLDLTILVAPLKSVDLVIKYIPIVNIILDGTLVSIPVKVTGSYASPKTTFLEPGAVEKELVGIMERTLKLPLTLIKPIISTGKKEDKE